MIVPIAPPPDDDEWEEIDVLRLYHAARDVVAHRTVHTHQGELYDLVPHDVMLHLGVVLNLFPAADRRPAAQRKRALTARASRT